MSADRAENTASEMDGMVLLLREKLAAVTAPGISAAEAEE